MTHRLVSICSAIVATACFSHAASAVTLYNPASGTPSAQGWMSRDNGIPGATGGVDGGRYQLDTTANPSIQAGSGLVGSVPLDTAGGVTLSFQLQVLAESHLRTDRAGFSLIAVGGNPADAVEIAFWNDRVWAYGPGFTHGVEALFDTGSAQTYSLTLQNQRFSLSAGGTSLLAGDLLDLRSGGPAYSFGNTVIFGDDTTSAAARVAVGDIVLNPVPEPASAGLFLLGGGALLAVARRRRATK